MILIGIMKDKHIDGATNVEIARTEIMTSLNALKSWRGLNDITMKDSGDGYIRSHLIEIDVAKKAWKYSLPKAER
jgi:hypothetical protein